MELEIIEKNKTENKIKSFKSGDIFVAKQPIGCNEEYTQVDMVITIYVGDGSVKYGLATIEKENSIYTSTRNIFNYDKMLDYLNNMGYKKVHSKLTIQL